MPAMGVAPGLFAEDHKPRRRLTVVREADAATSSIRVAIAGRGALARAGFRVLLERAAGIAVVGEAATADAVLALVQRTDPDVVLTDVHLPGLDTGGAMRDLLGRPGLEVMLVADRADEDRVIAALRAGAGGVLLEDAEPAELVRAVRVLARGAAVLPPVIARRLALQTSEPQARLQEDRMLTPKVTEIRRGGARGRFMALKPRPVSLALAR